MTPKQTTSKQSSKKQSSKKRSGKGKRRSRSQSKPKILPKILIVEDDRFLRMAYTYELTEEGFEVVTAVDGVEALSRMKEKVFDLVLLDILMPRMDGFEVLREIQKDETLKKVPVIMLTNLGQEKDIKECQKLGAVDYFIKSDHALTVLVEKLKKRLAATKTPQE